MDCRIIRHLYSTPFSRWLYDENSPFFPPFSFSFFPYFFSKIKTKKIRNLEREGLVLPPHCVFTPHCLKQKNTCFSTIFLLFHRKMHILALLFLIGCKLLNCYGEIALILYCNWTSTILQWNGGCITTEWWLHCNWMVIVLE